MSNRKLASRLAESASAAYFVQMAGLGIGFLAQLVLARLMGPDSYGIFAYAFTWQSAFVLVSTAGFYNTLLKYPAAYRVQGKWGSLRAVVRFGERLALGIGSLVAAGSLIFLALLMETESSVKVTFAMSFVLVPFMAFLRVRCSVIRSFGYIVSSLALDVPLRELSVLILASGVLWLLGKGVASYWGVAFMFPAVLVGLVGVTIIRRRCYRSIPVDGSSNRPGEWLSAALAMLAIEVTKMLIRRSDVLLVGLLLGTTPAGIYIVALYLADLVVSPLTAISFIFAPTIAGLHAKGRKAELQAATTLTARWSLLFGLVVAVPLIVFATVPLSLFGLEFLEGAGALRILLIGALVRAAIGTVEPLMMMTGQERQTAIVYAVTAVAAVIVNYFLIPRFGIEGAAIASASVMLVSTVLLAALLKRATGLVSGVIGARRLD